MIRTRVKKDGAIEIICFYEPLAMHMVGKIVPRESAVLAGFNSISVHANRQNMVELKVRLILDYAVFMGSCRGG